MFPISQNDDGFDTFCDMLAAAIRGEHVAYVAYRKSNPIHRFEGFRDWPNMAFEASKRKITIANTGTIQQVSPTTQDCREKVAGLLFDRIYFEPGDAIHTAHILTAENYRHPPAFEIENQRDRIRERDEKISKLRSDHDRLTTELLETTTKLDEERRTFTVDVGSDGRIAAGAPVFLSPPPFDVVRHIATKILALPELDTCDDFQVSALVTLGTTLAEIIANRGD